MSEYLPIELVTEILKRLPVKSLIQFRCVCKAWRSLITSPDFITMHLNQTTSDSKTNTHTLVRHYSKAQMKEIYSLHFDNEAFDEMPERRIQFPFGMESKFYFRVVGSCNGLLCLSDDLFGYMDTIILWNPMIRRYLMLPNPGFSFDCSGTYMFVLGFGVDPNTSDHKVVRMAFVQGIDRYIVPPVVEVFSLRLGTWRSIATAIPYNIPEHFWSQAYINGAVHWVAYHLSKNEGVRTFCSLILTFDMGSEEFGELGLPKNLAGVSPVNMAAAVFGGSLSILQYDRRIWTNSCSFWVMEEYGNLKSWVNLFNIDLEGALGTVLGLRRNGELLLSTRTGELVSYNYGTRTSLNIGLRGTNYSFYVGSYMESLILLTDGNKGLGSEASMVGSASSSPSSWTEEESGELAEHLDIATESNELWVKAVILQYSTALFNQL